LRVAERNYDIIDGPHVPIKAWTRGVLFEAQAQERFGCGEWSRERLGLATGLTSPPG
jgi:hypothetical protein